MPPSKGTTRLQEFSQDHFEFAASILFLSAFLLRIYFLNFFVSSMPAVFPASILGYLIKNTASSPWRVDFAYPPLIYIFYSIVSQISLSPFITQLPTIVADLLGGFFLLRIASQVLDRFRSLLVLAAYLFHPILIWTSVVFSFDSIAIFFSLLGLHLATRRRTALSPLALGLGINSKWFPALLIPPIFRRHWREFSIFRLSLYLLFPVITLLTSVFWLVYIRVVSLQQLTTSFGGYYQNRGPDGFSPWMLALILGLRPNSNSLLIVAYTIQILSFLAVSRKLRSSTDLEAIKYTLIASYLLVNLAIQVYPQYLLWFYPFLLLVAFQLPKVKQLVIILTLTSLTYALPLFYIYSHFNFNLTNNRWPSPSTLPTDYPLFLVGQLATWLLLAFLLIWTKVKDSRECR